jgi:predicted DNA-binding protein
MAPSKVFSVRLAADLADRVEEIAQRLGCRPPSVVKAAVESYLDDCDRGLPASVPEPARIGRPPKSASSTAPRPVRVDTVSQVHQWALNRQALLNKAKDRSK